MKQKNHMAFLIKYRIDKILEGIPNDNEEKIKYIIKIKKYSNECGCAWGANFLMISVLGLIVYLLFYYNWSNVNPFKLGLTSMISIFICACTGKMIGIAIAKIKLNLLYKLLINTYKS